MHKKVIYLLLAVTVIACGKKEVAIESGDLTIRFNDLLHSEISSTGKDAARLMNGFAASEYIEGKDFVAKDFALQRSTQSPYEAHVGHGTQWTLKGVYQQGDLELEKTIVITVYDQFPGEAFYKVSYVNKGSGELEVKRWVNHRYQILPAKDSVLFWSFQGESTGARRDWVLPLKAGFTQRNFMGMNNSDYGGGIPVTDLWRPDRGIAIGHAELSPKLVSLPVKVDSASDIRIEYDLPAGYKLAPGDTLTTYETFVNLHTGDYYTALKRYGEVLRAKGLKFAVVHSPFSL